MSATEVIEEIKKLPVEEQRKILAFLRDQDERRSDVVSEDFMKMADEMFGKNSEMFRKLAQ